jgi:predicted phage terminase large subunit-like protein
MALADVDTLTRKFGETQAKRIYREYFRDPAHLEEFAELFPSYVPTKLADFHGELFDYYETEGNFAGAAPRGFSKSTVTDTVYLAFCALNGYYHFCLLFSDTFTQATGLLDGLKTELESNEMITWIYGDVRGRVWSGEGMIVRAWNENDGRDLVKILPRGVGMKVRGLRFKQYRPDLAILDDVENDEAVDNAERREKLTNWFRSALLPAMAKDISKIIIIGTLLHRESLLSKAIRGEGLFSGWNRKKWQGILDDNTSLWPERFTLEYLTGMRDDPQHPMYLGALHFSQEIQNNPISEKDQIIKPEWTNSRYNLSDQLQAWANTIKTQDNEQALRSWSKTHFKRVIGHIDPAISEKETADWWAMVTIGITSKCPICPGQQSNHVVILDVIRFRESDPEIQANYIGSQFMLWKQDKIKIESVAYQAGLYTITKNIARKNGINMPIWKWKPDRSKRRRAILQSGSWAGGMVHIRTDMPFASVFIEEVVQFPQGEHDDMFDAYLGAAEETVLTPRIKAFSQKPKGM